MNAYGKENSLGNRLLYERNFMIKFLYMVNFRRSFLVGKRMFYKEKRIYEEKAEFNFSYAVTVV